MSVEGYPYIYDKAKALYKVEIKKQNPWLSMAENLKSDCK